MDKPFSFLIVVPTLDSFQYLYRLTSSLQSQSFEHWRLLFVDGPSNSDHRRWLNSFCSSEPRANWVKQSTSNTGIFGAMNQGFAAARGNEWVLFWGSDDWAASSDSLLYLKSSLESLQCPLPDLVVCSGRYFDQFTLSPSRRSFFRPYSYLDVSLFRRLLFLGSSPPHQATLFGPRARMYLDSYADDFRISADLDYFLKISHYPDLKILCLEEDIVFMLSGGVSGVATQLRLSEVSRAYQNSFGFFWFIPFTLRYFRRLLSLLSS